ncbi:GAF domain-containing protein [Kineosporia sp. A_224]|uniref:sensor histidine kinase n=1 Tax=Kineosporia sp. A_224 TaxID=1962180 RepID=UPI000B4B0031|nr:GAF domain-containing protein [Kineosporia sp. A_224]
MTEPASAPVPASPAVDRRLLDAVVAVADGLELDPTLRRIVRAASDLTNAPFAALGVLGDDGLHRAFVYTGIDSELAHAIGHLPRGHGVLGHITRVGRAVRVSDIGEHPASMGFPAGHPPMKSFLGVPVGIGERVVGNLYLADKTGGFTAEDEDVVVALAAAAAVAVENSRLFEDARRREAWLAAAQEVSTVMLEGAEEDEALPLIARRAREVAGADVCGLVLPGWEGQWVLEVADGEHADELVGIVMPEDGRAVSVVRSGRGVRVADLSQQRTLRVPAMRHWGPALYAPLVAGDERAGVLVLLRRIGAREFTDDDLTTAQTFAGQAALALQLADGRRRSEEAEILEERARIARDLHDLVVQELFAMGMRLTRLRGTLDAGSLGDVDLSLESLDRVVRQIRSTIRALRDPDEVTGLVERLHSEANRAHNALGFQPVLTVVDDALVDAQVPPDVADDVIAVVREGLSNAARHARASRVEVTVAVDGGVLVVEVGDDGRGVDPGTTRRSGLENLGERARRHGGACEARSNGAGGTVLRWTAPLGD